MLRFETRRTNCSDVSSTPRRDAERFSGVDMGTSPFNRRRAQTQRRRQVKQCAAFIAECCRGVVCVAHGGPLCVRGHGEPRCADEESGTQGKRASACPRGTSEWLPRRARPQTPQAPAARPGRGPPASVRRLRKGPRSSAWPGLKFRRTSPTPMQRSPHFSFLSRKIIRFEYVPVFVLNCLLSFCQPLNLKQNSEVTSSSQACR